jgi:pimeloyl-ACP methyl ester carboxylesterase
VSEVIEPEEITLSVRGMELAAKRWGVSGQPRVLALHGWLDNASSFDGLARRISGVQLVALDLPGHGRSGWRSQDASYHFVDYVADVIGAAHALKWDRYCLLGHSMGAAISSMVAAVEGERVERAAFIDALGPLATPASEAPRVLREALEQERALLLRPHRGSPDLEEIAARLGEARSDVPLSKLLPLARRSATKGEDGVWRFGFDPRLQGASRLRLVDEHVLSFLESILCPVLLVRPTRGWPISDEEVARRSARVANLHVEWVEGGHHVHMASPDLVAPVIEPFLMASTGGGQQ